MLKKIPDGMYYRCENAVTRNAQNTLKKFLAKLGIKSADDTYELRRFFTGSRAQIKLNGKIVAYAQNVSYTVGSPTPIDDGGSSS